MKKQWRAVALDETGDWNREYDEGRLMRLCKKIYTVYVYNPNVAVHCCEITPSYEMQFMGYVPIYDYYELTDEDRDYVFDEILEATSSTYNDRPFIYVWCHNAEAIPHILLGPETTMPLKEVSAKDLEDGIQEMWNTGWMEQRLYSKGLLQ